MPTNDKTNSKNPKSPSTIFIPYLFSSGMQYSPTPYEASLRLRVGYGHIKPKKGAQGASPFRRRTFRPHGTADWCLILVVEGCFVIYPESEHQVTLHPGSAVLFPPHTAQDYTLHDDYDEGKTFWAHFFPEVTMQPVLNWATSPTAPIVLSWQHDATLNEAILDACRRCLIFMESNYVRRRSLALLKLEEVLRLIQQVHPANTLCQLDDRVANALQYVAENIHLQLSAKTIAEEVGLSASRFAAIFIKNMQCSIMEYVEKQRLTMASNMLTSSEAPISVIAEKCGFSSVYYFSKRFRKSRAMSPTEYRKSTHD